MLSTDDYGRDLATVQTLQRKHEGIDRDLGALQEKVWHYYISFHNISLQNIP